MQYILKNGAGRYFTMTPQGMDTTEDFKQAFSYGAHTADMFCRAFNAKFRDDMVVVPFDIEAITYYPKCFYQAFDEGDARRTAERIRKGKQPEYSDATALRVEGVWFVFARLREVAEV